MGARRASQAGWATVVLVMVCMVVLASAQDLISCAGFVRASSTISKYVTGKRIGACEWMALRVHCLLTFLAEREIGPLNRRLIFRQSESNLFRLPASSNTKELPP